MGGGGASERGVDELREEGEWEDIMMKAGRSLVHGARRGTVVGGKVGNKEEKEGSEQ